MSARKLLKHDFDYLLQPLLQRVVDAGAVRLPCWVTAVSVNGVMCHERVEAAGVAVDPTQSPGVTFTPSNENAQSAPWAEPIHVLIVDADGRAYHEELKVPAFN
jgi:hypothetical protein